MDGQDFYKRFRFEFNPENNHDVKDVYDKDKVKPAEWTDLMSSVLTKIMLNAGFDTSAHKKEVSLLRGNGRGRVDHKWQGQNETVFLELENNITNIHSEIGNLLNSDGDLKVLITYSSNSSKRDELRKELLQQLKEHRTNRKFEFLLIMGKDDDMKAYNDWEAFHYRPSFEEVRLTV